MAEPPQPLDVLTVPLWGSRLVEASAGTGKTWTLAALVLRLVLGHGKGEGEGGADGDGTEDGNSVTRFSRPLAPSEILVMTFTRAATRELSGRIRERLAEAAACLRGEQAPQADDTVLHGLLSDWPGGLPREQAAWLAAQAAEAMDEAAVHTIDAWCQRMLREHAFDSGCLFDEALQPDEAAISAEAVRDHWRQQVLPLSQHELALVLSVWSDIGRMTADVQGLLPHAGGFGTALSPSPTVSLATLCADLLQQRGTALAAIKAGWADRVQDLRQWLASTLRLNPCPFNKTKLKMASVTPWMDALQAWAEDPQLDAPALKAAATVWVRLTPAGIEDALNGKAALQVPPAIADHLQRFADLRAQLATLPDAGPPIRRHAAACVAARVQSLKAQAGTYGYADMLVRLDAALHGPRGAALRERIVAQYPVALVDEFQDTSPIQYRILDRLYRVAQNQPATALFLIGDPKQSIYGFRGADIRSYLRARRATAGRHLVLSTNHRSTAALVDVVNRLFDSAEQRPGRGAFAFREAPKGEGGAVFDPLPFLPVQARGRAETFAIAGQVQPALTLCHDGVLRSGEPLRAVYGDRCAEYITDLLNEPAAGFDGPAAGHRRLQPADIAVLVRNGQEADAVRQALARRGVMSVYLSDRDSVFASPEAADLQRWLLAVSNPLDVRRVRAALATRTIGLSLPELLQIASDEPTLEQHLLLMADLQQVWQRQGVLAMLRQTLHRLALPLRWQALPGGERRLTNLLHLAELLQSASARLDGEHALMRWLAEQREAEGGGATSGAASGATPGEEQLVRLESDADLVQVVTVHKSKGLEYAIVCLPFATTVRAADGARRGYVLASTSGDGDGDRDDNGAVDGDRDGSARQPMFSPDRAALAQAEQERLREDLRLLYVALTRARHALWLGVGALQLDRQPVCTFGRSALGHLPAGGAQVEAAEIGPLLAFNFGDLAAVRIEGADDDTACTQWVRPAEALPLAAPRQYRAAFDRQWTVGSFSALVASLGSTPLASPPGLGAGRRDDEPDPARPQTAKPSQPSRSQAPWHRFPRGALAGNFLHDQLQWLAEQGFRSPAADPALALALHKRCERMGYGEQADDVLQWLGALLATRLPPLAAPLPDLTVARAELEFWMPAQQLPSARIDALCRQHLLPGLPRPALPARSLHGMVMGFADLVFEHQGRWWVLDYKSNALGDDDAAYDTAALATAVVSHRYDVQAALYQLALHRLLRQRLRSRYDPGQHLGGAIVLFLRGIHGAQAGCCHLPAVLPLLQALDRELGGGSS